MAKLVKNKKETSSKQTKASEPKKRATKKDKKAVDLEKSDDEQDDSEGTEEQEIPNDNGHNENRSTLLDDCDKAFGTHDLYKILDLDKSKATSTDIKKAYYKLSLVCHPDKVNDESKKEESKFKFQTLGKIYSILSDGEKKKLYDDTGVIEGEDQLFSENKDWDQYFRMMFKKITKADIKSFFEKYKDSDEERKDLAKHYEEFKGDFDMILEYMYSSDLSEDEPRFRDILNDMIKKGEIKKYDAFVKESKKKANKRKAAYEKEAVEAEKLRKDMGIDESQEALKNTILSRRQAANDQFLDKLAEKYSNIEKKNTKKKPAAAASNGKKNGKKVDESDEENINEDDSESDEESMDEDDEEVVKPKNKKTSRVIKRTASSAKSKATNGKTKVKRL